MKYSISYCIILFMLASCQKFLEIDPDSTQAITINQEEIAELLTGAYPSASYFTFLEPRTDNISERKSGKHTQLNEAMFFWEDYEQDDIDTPLHYWNECYRGIANVNQALECLSKIPVKSDQIKALYGEAFLLRAYLHFMLVNIWSEPYSPANSKVALGIPYVTKSEKEANPLYDRVNVSEVYEHIEKDLKYGISLVDDRFYKNPKFHFNKKAAYAFASRFYLMKGEWDNVIRYSDYVLGNNPKILLRNWNDYNRKFFFNRKLLYTQYASSNEPSNLLLATTESRLARSIPQEKYGVTDEIANEIFESHGIEGSTNDKKLHMESLYLFNYDSGKIQNAQYIAKFDEKSSSMSIGSYPRDLYVTNVLFSTDEVMFNRMEAYTMLREYDMAINDLNLYMNSKFGITLSASVSDFTQTSSSNYELFSPFYGLSVKQLALIKIIIGFKRQEFLHEGLRWFDIRRFKMPVKRKSKYPFYHALEKEDPRKLLQIPAEAVKKGLLPNPR